MSIQALAEYTRIAKYARYLPEQLRRETWAEQVDRVFEMHTTKYANKLNELAPYLNTAKDAVSQKKVLGSQRALQFGGDPIFKHNARLYNCVVSFADRPRFFQEFMYLLLCGSGAGFSVQRHHVAKLPEVAYKRWIGLEEGASVPGTHGYSKLPVKTFVIPDNIEGWADAVGVLLSSYFIGGGSFPEFDGCYVEFDFSLIRPAGAALSSGAKAPGPDGLRSSLDKIRSIVEKRIAMSEDEDEYHMGYISLRPIDVYDICMHASDAVISGGVRRSATICVFSPDDLEMAHAKTGDWFYTNPQRGRSNNSALLLRDKTTKEEFEQLMQSVRQFGEPGFVWSDSTELLVNPCVEIGMWPVLKEVSGLGLQQETSGWQFCNLCEINGGQIDTPEDFYAACEAAAILGTLQAGYTDFPYLGEVTELIVRREALLGVSITGLMDAPEVLFNPEVLRNGAQIVKSTNREVARILGINPAARTTCVKPSGTSSLILGTASGIHPHHSKRYFRRVMANELENPMQHYKTYNPRAVEASVWDPNGKTEVITFLCEVPKGAKTKNQISAIDLLGYVKLVQQHWVAEGTTPELCTQPWLKHNVSNTINVKSDEWDSVTDYIFENRQHFAGIALLPHSGDKDLPQMPFCAVPTAYAILQEYGEASLFASGLITTALDAWNGNLWKACDELLGISSQTMETLSPQHVAQQDWIHAATKFAERFFESNLKQLTYCLKDVYNLNLWEKLSKEHKPVDWTLMSEITDEVDFGQDAACAGGACEMPAWMLEEPAKEKSVS